MSEDTELLILRFFLHIRYYNWRNLRFFLFYGKNNMEITLTKYFRLSSFK